MHIIIRYAYILNKRCKMQIKINMGNNENYIHNLAFIKALLIKDAIEDLDMSYEEKVQIKNEILEYLENH